MKTTISQIDYIIDSFERRVTHLTDKREFESAKKDFQEELQKLQLEDPIYIPYSVGNDIKDILKSISTAAEEHQDLQMIYAGGGGCKLVQDVCIDYPMFTEVHGSHVLIKPFDSNNFVETDAAERTLNQYLLFVLLSYPRGSVRVNFIDPDFIGLGDVFMKHLGNKEDAPICRLFQDRNAIEHFLSQEMTRRMFDINRLGDRFYADNPRYELVVMFNNPSGYQPYSNELNTLLNRGSQFGLQFVVLSDVNAPINPNAFDLLSQRSLFTELDNNQELPDQQPSVHYTIDLFSQEDVFEQCMQYLLNGISDGNEGARFEGFSPLPPIEDSTIPEQYFGELESIVGKNVTLPILTYTTYDSIMRDKFKIRNNRLYWQVEGNKKKNIVINYSDQSEDHAIDLLNQLVMNILLSLPVTKVHCNLINCSKDPWARFLAKNIDSRIVDVIYESGRVPMLYSKLSKLMEDDSNNLGCSLERKNMEDGTIYRPYEIVVLNANDANNRGELTSLFKNGANSGIYFIVMNNKDEQPPYAQNDSILNLTSVIQTINADDDFFMGVPMDIVQKANIFTRDREWMPAATKYINDRSVVKVFHDWEAIINAPYPENSPELSAIIGYEQGTGVPVKYKMDIAGSHYHSFVIGGTGSGKTSFLHNIVLSFALKYKPEDLELYLIDLKGPEFGRYKQLQQAGAVLVDKSDDLITYEVIGSLVKKMLTRKEMFADSGGDLAKYNKIHPNNPLPQILLIVDECQNLFKTNSENPELARKIVDAITIIATEGRAFGIHLLMATQSLNNCPLLDQGVLNQFQDFWILPCVDTDAKMLVKAEHKEIVGQEANRMEREKTTNRGQCFLQGTDGYHRFKYNFISDDKKSIEEKSVVEQFIERSINKASGHNSNGQVFFSGRQNYSLYANADRLVSQNQRYLVASAGQNISFDQAPNLIHLIPEQGQNILTMGYNDKQFVTRASIDLLLSLILSSRKNELGYRFLVINSLGLEGAEYNNLLKRMADNGYIDLLEPKQSGSRLKSLCAEIGSDSVTPTILTILGQEKFNLLKNNADLPSDTEKSSSSESDIFTLPDENDIQGTLSIMANLNFGVAASQEEVPSDVKTYRDALRYILQKGPERGVHTVLQVNKASEIALSNSNGYSIDNLELYKLFGHIVFLQVDKDTESFFSLYELQLHEIQEAENRLRAYYYNPNGGSSQLISPYMLPTKKIQKGNTNEYESALDVEATFNELVRNY